jgi:hypothetical protein
MPETLSTQLGGLAEYADRNASLAPAATLRRRAAGRTLRRRRGAAALVGGGALAIGLGVTSTGVVLPAHSSASTPQESAQSPGSARLTSYQTTVLADAHVTKANLAVLKKMHLNPLQIQILAEAYRTAHQIAGAGGSSKVLTVAEIASVVKVKLTIAQLAASYSNMTVGQIEAVAKADLTAAQLAALGG